MRPNDDIDLDSLDPEADIPDPDVPVPRVRSTGPCRWIGLPGAGQWSPNMYRRSEADCER